MKYTGYIFDLNGTMVDDMDYHVQAWHHLVNHNGANISMEKMKEEAYGKNDEVLERIFPGRFTEEEKQMMGLEKQNRYQSSYRPVVKEVRGFTNFLKAARLQDIKLAIGSAATRSDTDFIVEKLQVRHYFDAVISAEDVQNSKPDAETFLLAAGSLQLLPGECLVFEDSPKGAEAALGAGMNCVIICTQFKAGDFKNQQNIIGFTEDYVSLRL